MSWPLTEGWLHLSLALYIFTGLFWLPDEWFRLYRIWFACGFPAFFAVIGIFWLMLTKPDIDFF